MNNRFGRRAQRARASGCSLTAEDAAIVKGMIARGDRQHDIAAFFGVNGGRIAEIAGGSKFCDVMPEDLGKLPQPVDPRLHRLVAEGGLMIEPDIELLPQLIQMRDKLTSLISSVENNSTY